MKEKNRSSEILAFIGENNFEGLEFFLRSNQNKIGLSWLKNSLTEFPTDENVILKNRSLFELIVELGEQAKDDLDLREAIQIETYRLQLEAANGTIKKIKL
ncbi:hypothetical protein [Paenibacillus sp. Leaf72]|uniref:hypothetical protein n=1 Tax=Paenibacillus sp. Leaf72 TaxID=1736234 RepID=UPI0006F209F5|nr:hypothetical protein [Paenibacillus sp. Leaf72]KQN96804.1 hypothetical protein ASF12_22285 [Paenibacillus sp. Leaf72]